MLTHLLRPFGNALARRGLRPEEQSWLLSARGHNPLLRARRAGIVATRVRLLAALFLALTPVWMAVEYFALPTDLWLAIGASRLAVILAFVGLLVALRRGRGQASTSKLAMLALFLVPVLFYVVATLLLSGRNWTGLAQAVVATHTFFPLLLVAGISLFPLTVGESLTLVLPMMLARGWLVWQVQAPGDFYAALGAIWFLALISGVGVMAAVSQLSFIIVLLRQTIRDPLTGAFSRASGEELLELESTIAARNAAPFAVAFIDLDHFKEVNDRFGHEAGDRVLAQASEAIARQLRGTDILLRWGGEEFVLLLPNTRCPQAMVGLERLRLAGFGSRPDGRPQTASIGVAERVSDALDRGSQLVELADRRMYQAKQDGRNRLVGCVPPYDARGSAA
ncbi:putative diguanylate cyclase DgcQ [Burkholderiales bacterium]|nr:MAG: GGDEF domain-containing protein [Burkholderiales bacterium]CAG0988995.1 putative diguanylate cyclase DgcQ [Burkholderiales bacterium]